MSPCWPDLRCASAVADCAGHPHHPVVGVGDSIDVLMGVVETLRGHGETGGRNQRAGFAWCCFFLRGERKGAPGVAA